MIFAIVALSRRADDGDRDTRQSREGNELSRDQSEILRLSTKGAKAKANNFSSVAAAAAGKKSRTVLISFRFMCFLLHPQSISRFEFSRPGQPVLSTKGRL